MKPVKTSSPFCRILPYTRIHPQYIDLGLKFLISDLTKEVLIFYNLSLRNLTLTFHLIITSYELLDKLYGT